jgi:hypothetical protein
MNFFYAGACVKPAGRVEAQFDHMGASKSSLRSREAESAGVHMF